MKIRIWAAIGILGSLVLSASGAVAQESGGALPKMSTPVSNLTFVVFDTETTGLSPEKDRIVEIGAVKIRNGKIVEERDWLINPGQPIPARATKVHGITTEMVKDKPSFAEVYPEFESFADDAILIAHNARFDVAMVKEEIERNNLSHPGNVVIDSLKLFRTWYPEAENHKLAFLADYVGITGDGFHRGDADSRFTALILFEGLKSHTNCTNLRKLLAACGGVIVF